MSEKAKKASNNPPPPETWDRPRTDWMNAISFLSASESVIIATHFSMCPTFFEYANASAALLLRFRIRLIFAWLQLEESSARKSFFLFIVNSFNTAQKFAKTRYGDWKCISQQRRLCRHVSTPTAMERRKRSKASARSHPTNFTPNALIHPLPDLLHESLSPVVFEAKKKWKTI